jgi:hypothetical protein
MKSNSTQTTNDLQGYGGKKLPRFGVTGNLAWSSLINIRKIIQRSKSLVVIVLLLFTVSFANAATYYSRATGNWNSNTTWSLTSGGGAVGAGIFPIAGDVVIIQGGFNVTVNISNAACSSVQLGGLNTGDGAGTLTFAASSQLTVSGAVSLGNTGSTTRDGTLVMTAGGTLICASISSNSTTDAFTEGTGTVELSATNTLASTDAGGQFSTFNNLLINGGTTTLARNTTIAGNLTINSSCTLDLVTFTANRSAAGGVLTVAGSLLVGGTNNFPTNFTTFTATGGTVNFDNAGAQTVGARTYNNLTLSGSGTKTVGAATVVTGNLTITGSAVANLTGTANTANALYLGATQQTSGTWGFTGSGATNINTTYFLGGGRVIVATGSCVFPNIGLTVGGTGSICSGTGTNITVALSESGVNYQLRNGVTPVGSAVAGTGGTINLATGNLASNTTFNVLATNASTFCAAQLTGTATITINPLPNIALTVGGTGSLCSGTGTNITVALSESGVNYQLRNGITPVGSVVAGTGSTINLPTGNLASNTTFNVLATNSVTTCFAQLTGTATVTVNPLPNIALTVGGGGAICSGTGTNITVALSESGVNYQLRNGITPVGSPVGGTGGTINLPTGNLVSTTTFNVLATNASTTCFAQLTNTATVTPQTQTTAPVITTSPICAAATTVSGTSVALAAISVYKAGSTLIGVTTADGVGGWTATVTALAAADVVTATASAGGSCVSAPSAQVTVQSITNLPVISGPLCAGSTLVSGSSENNAVINVYRAGTTFIGTATASGAGVWTASVSTLAAADVVTATASVGGKCLSSASSPVTVLVVTAAPAITTTQICAGTTSISGTSENNASITVYKAGSTVVGTAVANGSGVWTAGVSALAGADVVTATAVAGGKCVSTFSSSVIVNALPVATFTSQAGVNSCLGVNVTYTTQPGMTNYVWGFPGVLNTDYSITSGGTSNDNTVTLRYLTTGSKTVTVYYTNSNGCTAASATSSTPTTVNTLPVVTYTAQAAPNVCLGVDVTYTTQTGMTGYTWLIPGQILNTDYSLVSGGTVNDNSITLHYLTAGSKYVTVNYINGNGCSAASAVPSSTITANALPVVTFIAPPTGACIGVDVTYTTQAGMSTYLWTIPGTAGVDYTISSGGIGTTSNTVTLKYLTTGIKTVTVNYTNLSGCTAAAATVSTITVSTLPAIGLTVRGSATICSGTGTNITVDGSVIGTNYQLRNDNANELIGGSIPGNGGTIYLPTGPLTAVTTFNVLATLGSCSAELTDVAMVNISPLPVLNLTVGGTSTICSGSGTNITVASSVIGTTYQLRNNNADELVGSPIAGTGASISLPTGNLTSNTTFNVLATLGSCSSQLTNMAVVTLSPLPAIGLTVGGSGAIITGTGTNITVDGSVIGTNYQLRNNTNNELIGTAIGGTGGTIFLPTGALTVNTTFNVLATLGSCAAQLTNLAVVTVGATGIGDVKETSGLTLKNHPNPFGGNTTISYSLPSDGSVKLTIRNISGQVVKTPVNEFETQGDYTFNIDLSDLQSGVYLATIILKKDGKETIRTIRLVKGR